MPLSANDLKTVETYTKAIQAEAKKIAATGTKFWAYKDIELPTAKGAKQRVMLVSFGNQDAIKTLVTGKAPVSAGNCRAAGSGLVFEPTAGKVPSDVLGKLLAKPVRELAAGKAGNLLPTAIRRGAAAETPLPPEVKKTYIEMTELLQAMGKANANHMQDVDRDALATKVQRMGFLAAKFIALSPGHLDTPEIKQALEGFRRDFDEYSGAYKNAIVTDVLKSMQKALAAIAQKLKLDPPADIKPPARAGAAAPITLPKPTSDRDRSNLVRVALMDMMNGFRELERTKAATGSLLERQKQASKVSEACKDIERLEDSKANRFLDGIRKVQDLSQPGQADDVYPTIRDAINGLHDWAVTEFEDALPNFANNLPRKLN